MNKKQGVVSALSLSLSLENGTGLQQSHRKLYGYFFYGCICKLGSVAPTLILIRLLIFWSPVTLERLRITRLLLRRWLRGCETPPHPPSADSSPCSVNVVVADKAEMQTLFPSAGGEEVQTKTKGKGGDRQMPSDAAGVPGVILSSIAHLCFCHLLISQPSFFFLPLLLLIVFSPLLLHLFGLLSPPLVFLLLITS